MPDKSDNDMSQQEWHWHVTTRVTLTCLNKNATDMSQEWRWHVTTTMTLTCHNKNATDMSP